MRFIVKHFGYVLIFLFLVPLYFLIPVADKCITEEAADTTTCGQISDAYAGWLWLRTTHPDPNWIIAISTVFVAAFTVALWKSTSVLSNEARRQRRLTIRSLTIAKRASDAAKVSADALQHSERAWLILDKIELNKFPDTVLQEGLYAAPFVRYRFKNFGNSPAFVTSIQARFVRIKKGEIMPTTPDYSEARNHLDNSIPIPPKKHRADDAHLGEIVYEKDRYEIQTGERRFVIYGRIQYLDIFGTRRETRFCSAWRVPAGFITEPAWIFFGGSEYNKYV
jgi:hypothetical protein